MKKKELEQLFETKLRRPLSEKEQHFLSWMAQKSNHHNRRSRPAANKSINRR